MSSLLNVSCLPVSRGVAQDELLVRVLDQQAGQAAALEREHRDRLIALANLFRGQQNRLHQLFVGCVFRQSRQVRAQRILLLGDRMAFCARDVRLMEDDRTTLGITQLSGRPDQGLATFLSQLLLKRRRASQHRCGKQCQHEAQATESGKAMSHWGSSRLRGRGGITTEARRTQRGMPSCRHT